jgi:hypothetical protein
MYLLKVKSTMFLISHFCNYTFPFNRLYKKSIFKKCDNRWNAEQSSFVIVFRLLILYFFSIIVFKLKL